MNTSTKESFCTLSQTEAQEKIREITGRCREESEVRRDLIDAGFNVNTASINTKGCGNTSRITVLVMGPNGAMISG